MQNVKVLYVGHYKDGTGWADAAIRYITAMDKYNIEVVPRAIKLNNNPVNIPERILELEQRSADGCEVVIQHVLPHLMEYNPKFRKNIGICIVETRGWEHGPWVQKLGLMDEVWACNKSTYGEAKRKKHFKKCYYVPHSLDLEEYVPKKPLFELPGYTFAHIGDFNRRKNLSGLLRAFHSEFDINEPVNLVIKASKYGHTPGQVKELVQKTCDEVKKQLRLYPTGLYHKEIILTDYLSREDMLRLHNSYDCLVTPSYGEAFNLIAADAMGYGKPVIASNCGAHIDHFKSQHLVEGHYEPCFGEQSFPFLFTGRETWFKCDEMSLRERMRSFYEQDLKEVYANQVKARDYSISRTGLRIQKRLTNS